VTYIDPTGLQIPTLEEIRDAIGAEQRAAIDPLLANDTDSVLGTMNAIVASHAREAWETLQDAAWENDPRDAEGAGLERISRITGTLRRAATRSTVTVDCTLAGGTSLAALSSQVRVTGSDPAVLFRLVSSFTAPVGPSATYPLIFEAVAEGPVPANPTTLTTIATPTAGWSAASNPGAATLGRAEATDEELRQLRLADLFRPAAVIPKATEQRFLEVPGVLSVRFRENLLDVKDPATGLPGRTWQIIYWDGPGASADPDDLAAALVDSRQGGIAGGAIRALEVPFEVEIFGWSAAGYSAAALKAAILADVQATQRPGRDVYYSRFAAICAANGVPEIQEIRLRKTLSPAAPWAVANIPIDAVSVATLLDATITLNVIAGPAPV
jgi:hypothetical protein